MEREIMNKLVAHFVPKWARGYAEATELSERVWFLGCMSNMITGQVGPRYDTEVLIARIKGAILEAAAQRGDFSPALAERAALEFVANKGGFSPLCQAWFEDAETGATEEEKKLCLPACKASIERLEVLDALKGEFTVIRRLTDAWVADDESRCRQIED